MAVPSMLIVAPRGMVKEEMRRDTPIFLCRVSMDMGMVALEVAVENAKPITGRNFFRNLTGLSPVKPLSMAM